MNPQLPFAAVAAFWVLLAAGGLKDEDPAMAAVCAGCGLVFAVLTLAFRPPGNSS